MGGQQLENIAVTASADARTREGRFPLTVRRNPSTAPDVPPDVRRRGILPGFRLVDNDGGARRWAVIRLVTGHCPVERRRHHVPVDLRKCRKECF